MTSSDHSHREQLPDDNLSVNIACTEITEGS